MLSPFALLPVWLQRSVDDRRLGVLLERESRVEVCPLQGTLLGGRVDTHGEKASPLLRVLEKKRGLEKRGFEKRGLEKIAENAKSKRLLP